MSENAFPDALAPGYRLHWYVLEQVLGQGGFGITYLARDTNLDQPVAVKEYLPAEVAGRRGDSSVRARTEEHDERYRWGLDRFIREARTLARFDHPNIVRVLSVFESNNTAYMVMRFERGETLAALLERRHGLPEAVLRRERLRQILGGTVAQEVAQQRMKLEYPPFLGRYLTHEVVVQREIEQQPSRFWLAREPPR
jgi:serine/threonine protein kinase